MNEKYVSTVELKLRKHRKCDAFDLKVAQVRVAAPSLRWWLYVARRSSSRSSRINISKNRANACLGVASRQISRPTVSAANQYSAVERTRGSTYVGDTVVHR